MRFILISLMLFGCAERTPAPNPALQNETVNYTKDSDLKVIKESSESKLYKAKNDYNLNKDSKHIEPAKPKEHHESVYKSPYEPEPLKHSTHKEWVEQMRKSNKPANQPDLGEFNLKF